MLLLLFKYPEEGENAAKTRRGLLESERELEHFIEAKVQEKNRFKGRWRFDIAFNVSIT